MISSLRGAIIYRPKGVRANVAPRSSAGPVLSLRFFARGPLGHVLARDLFLLLLVTVHYEYTRHVHAAPVMNKLNSFRSATFENIC